MGIDRVSIGYQMNKVELREKLKDETVIAIGMYHKYMIEHPYVREVFYFSLIGIGMFLMYVPFILYILRG